eukprot:5738332-Amphidinium_carterae.1
MSATMETCGASLVRRLGPAVAAYQPKLASHQSFVSPKNKGSLKSPASGSATLISPAEHLLSLLRDNL